MNNQRTLYLIIAGLIVLNVATLSYVFGRFQSQGATNYRMMGPDHNWKGIRKHMGTENEHDEQREMHQRANYNKPVAEAHRKQHDFGQIYKANGTISTTFEIENHGKELLEIGEISTSCSCTTAEMDKTVIAFDEKATLTVNFDPNFHDEPGGKFTRSVFVPTNDTDLSELQFDIFVEILE